MSFMYVANWKMNMNVDDSCHFATNYGNELGDLQKQQNIKIIICPSFVALPLITPSLNQYGIQTGAQNCSEFIAGAYTSQISAQSLQEIGVGYTIIGHSECRSFLQESNGTIAQKCARLLDHHIEPIICIGESLEAYHDKETESFLHSQVVPIIKILEEKSPQKIHIAYEPMWAIGTKIVPDNAYIEAIVTTIKETITHNVDTQPFVLYGGSVDEQTASALKSIKIIDGFLIGGASTNFQKLKKIIL